MKLIPLSKKGKYSGSYFAKVDDVDFDWLSQHNWSINKCSDNLIYVQRGNWKNGKNCSPLFMHREILGARKGQFVDHIDGNPLNNQRGNLRFCTKQQNSHNSKGNEKSFSKFKGVFLAKRNKKYKKVNGDTVNYFYSYWEAKIFFNGKAIIIGMFDTEIKAALAYNKKAKELFGEFARLNIID